MRGKIITMSAAALSASALGIVAYQAVSLPGQMGASLNNYSSSSDTTTSSSTSSSMTMSSSSTLSCGGSNGQCGGTCIYEGETCQWIESEWSPNLNHCGCAEGNSSSVSSGPCGGANGQCGGTCSDAFDVCTWDVNRGWCGCRTRSSSSSTSSSVNSTSSSVCSSNPGALRPNCPIGKEVRGTCDPSTCQSEWFNGMCLFGGLCATVSGGCSDTSQCNEQFQPCGAPGAQTCGGFCTGGDQCENRGTDSNGNVICGCRSFGYSSSF